MTHKLDPLFRPKSVAFIGGSNLKPTLQYHDDLGFDGQTFVVNHKYPELFGHICHASIEDLPEAPDLAFVAIRREAAVQAIEALRVRGCKAVICNAAGFAEMGADGQDIQRRLEDAAGDMVMLGPNSIGLANFLQPMSAMMDQFGVQAPDKGIAIVSQGGGFLCDAVFCDRSLDLTHIVGCGNQAITGIESCAEYLLDDPQVTCVGIAFEGLKNISGLRRAAVKALRLGKPIVAIKFGKSEVGAQVAASHTASMTGADAAWQAIFDRLGIISTQSESEFFETLKLINSGQIPKGRRVMVTAVSGVMSVMLADHLSAAGFEMPQPTGDRVAKLKSVLPPIATPCNPQDVTMAAWNNLDQQTAIYNALLDEGFDTAILVQNYPREGMWDIAEYEAQLDAMAAACEGREIAGLQLAPMVDCFPDHARDHTARKGMAAMQGLEECISALSHTVWWNERRSALLAEGLNDLETGYDAPAAGIRRDEAEAKSLITAAGVSVPDLQVSTPENAPAAATELGFPVALKALDPRLLHKTEVGAVRIGLRSADEVAEATAKMASDMAVNCPDIPLTHVLIETMAPDVVAEIMASVTYDPSVGPVMMIAGGGIEAEMWNDSTMLAAPFTRSEIARALNRLTTAKKIAGWRGRPAGDRDALLDQLEALAAFALSSKAEEIEINPILVGQSGAVAVDAVLKLAEQPERTT